MLNRTNRTLSANLNRLNLGTRSLAPVAGLNNGAKTLRIRHAHGVVMRAGLVGYLPRIPDSRVDQPSSPGSPFVPSRLFASPAVRPEVELAAAMSAPDSRRPFAPCEQPGGSEARPSKRPSEQGRTEQSNRQPLQGVRWLPGDGPVWTSTRATQGTIAARFAAVGG